MAVVFCPSIFLCLTPLIIIAVSQETNSSSLSLNSTLSIGTSVPQESTSVNSTSVYSTSVNSTSVYSTSVNSTSVYSTSVNSTLVDLNVTQHKISSLRQTTWISPTSTILNSQTHIPTTESSQITSFLAVTSKSDDNGGLTNKVATNSPLGKPSEVPPTQTPDSGLTMLAFGVMSFILILIIIMVILVTVVNFRERCNNAKEEGVKGYSSVVSDSHLTSNAEKESITLISVRTINADNDNDSLQISSVQSTVLDSEDQELSRNLFFISE